MNLMKPIINNKLTILIIIFLCISFFIQTYFEIENFKEENTPYKMLHYIIKGSGSFGTVISINNYNLSIKCFKDFSNV